MKKPIMKQALVVMLVTSSLAPGASFAQSPECCSDIVNAINNSTTTLGGKLDQSDADLVQQATQTNQYLANIWNYQSNDLNTRQAVSALINFQAAEIFRKYNYDQQLMFQVAPGTDWALSAGMVTGQTPLLGNALQFSNLYTVSSLGILGVATSITVNGAKINIQDAVANVQPLNLYTQMQNFFTQGDTTNLNMVNPGSLMFSQNVVTDKITSAQTQQLINILTNPFPNTNDDIKAKLALGGVGLTGDDKERLVASMTNATVLGLSSSAFADIVSRRTPAQGQTLSVMEIMSTYSQQRFTNPQWYEMLGAASDTAILRELAHMQAYNIWVQNQQFRLEEQQVALLASVNSMMAQMNQTIANLTKQLALAQAQATAFQAQATKAAAQADQQNASKGGKGG